MNTRPRRERGLTLVEAAVTTSIVAIVAGVALPSFDALRQRRHLEGAAAQLETDIQFARSAAVLASHRVRLDFGAGMQASCYVVHTGAAGDCDCSAAGAPVCAPAVEVLRVVRYDSETPLRLQSNSASIAFDPLQGTVTPTATVRVTARNGEAIHQIVNIMGRVRSCSPTLPGYKPC